MKHISSDCKFLFCICRSIIYIYIKNSSQVSIICNCLVCTGLCDDITINTWLCKINFWEIKFSCLQRIFLAFCKIFNVSICCCAMCIGTIALFKYNFVCLSAFSNSCHYNLVCIYSCKNLEFLFSNIIIFCITCCYCICKCCIRNVCLCVHNQIFIKSSCFFPFNCSTVIRSCCRKHCCPIQQHCHS